MLLGLMKQESFLEYLQDSMEAEKKENLWETVMFSSVDWTFHYLKL